MGWEDEEECEWVFRPCTAVLDCSFSGVKSFCKRLDEGKMIGSKESLEVREGADT